jgi:uncharacterized RDD family membrane protein YckC
LQQQADAVYRSLETRGLGKHVEPALLKLVRVDRDGQAVRRRAMLSAFSTPEAKVIAAFTEARLLSTHGSDAHTTTEAAHEALLRQWPPLRRAIDRASKTLATFARVEQLAEHWEASGGHPSYLQTGASLQRILVVAQGHRVSDLLDVYLRASIAYAAPSFYRVFWAFAFDWSLAFILIMSSPAQLREQLGLREGGEYYPWSFYAVVLAVTMLTRAIGYRFGRSIGMRWMGLVLTDTQGQRPTWKLALLRALMAPVPRRDAICGTVVVSCSGS